MSKAGRPKKYTTDVCNHKVVFCCGDDIYVFLKQEVDNTDVTVSEYIRKLIYAEMDACNYDHKRWNKNDDKQYDGSCRR